MAQARLDRHRRARVPPAAGRGGDRGPAAVDLDRVRTAHGRVAPGAVAGAPARHRRVRPGHPRPPAAGRTLVAGWSGRHLRRHQSPGIFYRRARRQRRPQAGRNRRPRNRSHDGAARPGDGALVVTSWPWYARTYRALLLKERTALYVESAVAAGAGRWRVLLRHALPNIIGPAAVLATANFGAVILNLAGLSFLGLGMQPPTPEWGEMINEAARYFEEYPWQMIAPGLCIAATVLAVNLLGDALRDVADPRTR
ncbi:MAG: ABC transporter permease [Chloroflexi bacterium]|nr:MAG: ABC transporter permease [Chloroflexota bacterium]